MELKTNDIVSVYKILSDAKLTKMDTSDKVKVIKFMRAIKPTATEWDSFIETVDKKCQGENHEKIIEKAKKWQENGEKTTLTIEERKEINEYLIKYNKDKETCIKDELDKVVSVEFEKISQSAFEKLLDSNDFEVKQMLELENVIKE